MTPEQLLERIAAWEDTHTEFKEKERPSADKLAEDIVAMANSGGDLIFGVRKDKKIVGIEDTDELFKLLENVCRNNIEPQLRICETQTILIDNRKVVVVSIPRGPGRPYRTNRGKYFIRGTAGKRLASREDIRELMISAGDLHPDEFVLEETDFSEIDRDYFRTIRPELAHLFSPGAEGALMRVLDALQLARGNRLTVAGLLCFGRDPQKLRHYWCLTAIRHTGTELGADFLDRRDIAGNVDHQLRAAQSFLESHLVRPDKAFGSLPPLPGQPPPVEAIMEAVVNAVAHRDYHLTAQVRLFIFDDRIEIFSPGRLLNAVTIEGMRLGGLHYPRNPTIFTHLSRCGWAKSAGIGIADMFRQMRERGLPDPELRMEANQLRVTLYTSTGKRHEQ